MNIPFTIEQFLGVFQSYNVAVWPMQIFLNFFALLAIGFAFRKTAYSDSVIGIILSFFWLWIGIVYHLIFFTSINKAAYLFGVLNILQGLIFLFAGVLQPKLSFKFRSNLDGLIGMIFVLYALVIYPILGHFLGHVYPRNPTFGLPCPTTIFTFGLLLWTDKAIPKFIFVIPFIWSMIGFSAAVSLNVREDFGLVVAGVLGVILIFSRAKRLGMS